MRDHPNLHLGLSGLALGIGLSHPQNLNPQFLAIHTDI
ncbi:MAG: hypothetical protein UT36_C0002G0043 [Candidatus Peregrinibacteria bacterium GW2011_GWF2_39_17]|nr:MAG: hypothetical protein UT36_C0002G0043 [Candidatus Peregrinibacteria bacterium GW2011_GWF2_39_17]